MGASDGERRQLDLFEDDVEDKPHDRVQTRDENKREPTCAACGKTVEGDVYMSRLGPVHRRCRKRV